MSPDKSLLNYWYWSKQVYITCKGLMFIFSHKYCFVTSIPWLICSRNLYLFLSHVTELVLESNPERIPMFSRNGTASKHLYSLLLFIPFKHINLNKKYILFITLFCYQQYVIDLTISAYSVVSIHSIKNVITSCAGANLRLVNYVTILYH